MQSFFFIQILPIPMKSLIIKFHGEVNIRFQADHQRFCDSTIKEFKFC